MEMSQQHKTMVCNFHVLCRILGVDTCPHMQPHDPIYEDCREATICWELGRACRGHKRTQVICKYVEEK